MKATEIPHDDGLIFGLRAMAPALLGKPVEQISPAELKKLSRMSHAGQFAHPEDRRRMGHDTGCAGEDESQLLGHGVVIRHAAKKNRHPST